MLKLPLRNASLTHPPPHLTSPQIFVMCKKNPKHKQRQLYSTTTPAAAAAQQQQQQQQQWGLGGGGGGLWGSNGSSSSSGDLVCPHWGAGLAPQLSRCEEVVVVF